MSSCSGLVAKKNGHPLRDGRSHEPRLGAVPGDIKRHRAQPPGLEFPRDWCDCFHGMTKLAHGGPFAWAGAPSSQIGASPAAADAPAAAVAAPSPPRPRFTLSVGVTGHRADRITPPRAIAVAQKLDTVLQQVREAALAMHAQGEKWFLPDVPDLRLVSALAEGADRLCAEAALKAEFALDVPLPFDRVTYCTDFVDAASCDAFNVLLDKASTVLELPGDRAAAETAYSLAGGAILAVADVLIAVWNGEAAAGRGGTGDVVASALAQGKPVIHVPINEVDGIRLLWPGDGPAAGSWHTALEPPQRAFHADALREVMTGVMLPPEQPAELAALASFLAEKEELLVRRIEYPLLLAVTGADKLRRSAWDKPPYVASTRGYWSGFDVAVGEHLEAARFAVLERAYCWSDNLATRFAQFFRSGHVVNFAFSAVAVALALFGFVFGNMTKIVFVILELLLIAVIVANTRVGHAEAWQQRWLDYRHLAERLRPMRSLKLLAIASPPSASASSRTGNQRWTDWYSSAIWRQLALPRGRIGESELAALVAVMHDEELAPEIRYHQKNAQRMMHVNRRLHRFGSICFLLTVVLCVSFLLSAALLAGEAAKSSALLFTVATATLPAFGSAAYGLRVQGDFAGSAARSAETADALLEISKELEGCPSLARAAALANAAAAVMLVDLAEWRLTYQQRALEIPG